MRSIAGTELCQKLERAGWALKRVRGSHDIYAKAGEKKILSVPVHGNKAVKPGLATRLAKDANISW